MNTDMNIHANHGRHRPSGGRRADNRDADIASPRPEIVEVARQSVTARHGQQRSTLPLLWSTTRRTKRIVSCAFGQQFRKCG